MPAHVETDAATEPCYVSTGHLPDPDLVMITVKRAYERFKGNTEGTNSDVYPALARVPSNLFGVCVVGTSGNVYPVGDADGVICFPAERSRKAGSRRSRGPCSLRPEFEPSSGRPRG